MNTITHLLAVVLLGCVLVAGHPATKQHYDDDDEVEIVPLERQRPPFLLGGGADDADAYEGILSSFFRNLQTQLKNIFNLERNVTASFPNFGFPNVDLSEGNTTSETKIVDGHKVTTNTTTYNKDGVFVKVFKTEIKSTQLDDDEPHHGGNDESSEKAKHDDIEQTNEIPRQGSFYDNLETFDEADYIPYNNDYNNVNEIQLVDRFGGDDNSIEIPLAPPMMPRANLADDIRVNEMLAAAGAPKNPDAEYIDFGYGGSAYPKYARR